MAIGSGLAASIGFADEAVYGTYVAPTRFLEFDKEDLKLNKTTMQGGGLAAGRYADLGSRRVLTTKSGSGSVNLEVTNQKFGLLFGHILGSTAAPVAQGATTAYLQTHVLGDNFGQSLTVQKGVPAADGTVHPYSFTGGKITSAAFECDVMGMLQAQLEFDFKNVVTSEPLAAPSYATGLAPFHGGQLAIKMGTYGAETDIDGIKKMQLKFERAMNTSRFFASSTGFPATKSEPIMNDVVKVTGSLETEFTDTTIADWFTADESTSVVFEWTGPVIEGIYTEKLTIRVPMIFFNGDTPQVEGPDVVTTGYEFTGQHDGTNDLISVEYTSTDTAL